MNLKVRIAKAEQQRFGRNVAHLTEKERQEWALQRYAEGLPDEELSWHIEAARAALAAKLNGECEQPARAETAEEFDAWLQGLRDFLATIRSRPADGPATAAAWAAP